jgi:hypothetical protein
MSAALATVATGLFAGAALYVTLVEHPARLACGTAIAVAQFRPRHRRGAALQAPLAVLALLPRWAALHAVRTLLGLGAFALGAALLP